MAVVAECLAPRPPNNRLFKRCHPASEQTMLRRRPQSGPRPAKAAKLGAVKVKASVAEGVYVRQAAAQLQHACNINVGMRV